MFLMYIVDRCHDQIWFTLSVLQDIRFGAVYIPPSDSPYHTGHEFSDIQAQCMKTEKQCILFGDLNARIPILEMFNNLSFN